LTSSPTLFLLAIFAAFPMTEKIIPPTARGVNEILLRNKSYRGWAEDFSLFRFISGRLAELTQAERDGGGVGVGYPVRSPVQAQSAQGE
ncbi:MAG: hypothetical protein MJ240_04245, partial [Kiritimatiellae bacterium]|nr:hypothetical protein [Kiritimatiellia bacterium]